MADIVADLGMSPANIYRFFPSRDAINASVCGRLMNEFADPALAIARTEAARAVRSAFMSTAFHFCRFFFLVSSRVRIASAHIATSRSRGPAELRRFSEIASPLMKWSVSAMTSS